MHKAITCVEYNNTSIASSHLCNALWQFCCVVFTSDFLMHQIIFVMHCYHSAVCLFSSKLLNKLRDECENWLSSALVNSHFKKSFRFHPSKRKPPPVFWQYSVILISFLEWPYCNLVISRCYNSVCNWLDNSQSLGCVQITNLCSYKAIRS